jgi:hypothetical protein
MPWGDGMAMAGSFPSRRGVNGAVSGQPIAEPGEFILLRYPWTKGRFVNAVIVAKLYGVGCPVEQAADRCRVAGLAA